VLNKHIRDKQPSEVLEDARRQKNMLYAAGGHNIAIEPQLAEFFIRDAKKAISILSAICTNNCRRGNDLPTFLINVHAMKSALINIGENELASEASKLEQAGRDQNVNLILLSLPDFVESLEAVVEKLQPTEEDLLDEESQALAGDKNFLMEKLQIIQTACDSYNKKAAKAALADLKQKSWPRSVREQLSAIARHLLHSEFDETTAITRQMMKAND
jgi:HPt (histidine-containing phosphotransfer) domain-containing protein